MTSMGPIIRIAGIKLCVDRRFSKTMRDALFARGYENDELRIVRSQLRSADTVMELGTGIGLISSFCARRIAPNRVFTFEANPVLEPHIRKTYRLNGVNPNLEMCLIARDAGRREFYVHGDFWASSTVRFSSNARKIIVPAKSFNDEVRRIQPTFLIIDVEGGEYELFRDAELGPVHKVLIELHEWALGRKKTEFVKAKLFEARFRLQTHLSIRDRLFWRRQGPQG